MTETQNLLAEYVQTGSDAAFRELVARYIDLVYSSAIRLVDGDMHRAEDVAQTVFVDLARTAQTLSKDVMLGGWLHRHTCFVAMKTMRSERRRESRERQAVEMNALQDNSGADFSHIAPILDEAINELGEADRTAILLRFFDQHDFLAVGKAIGANEDAARMRVTRALEKLESMLKRRGATTSATALVAMLSANVIQAAPVGMIAVISSAASLTTTAILTSTVVGATKTIAMTTFQKTVIAATLAIAIGMGIYGTFRAPRLEKQVQLLREQRPISEENEELLRNLESSKNHLATLVKENETLRGQVSDIYKLRGQIALLRAASNELANSTTRDDPTEVALKVWLNKVNIMKQRFQEWPGAKTPETVLLTEEEWLEAAKQNLDSDEELRKAMSELRWIAKGRFAGLVDKALERYAESNNEKFPTSLSQLAPYLDPPANSFLDSYEIAKPGAVTVRKKRIEWAMTSKGAIRHDRSQLSDEDYDMFVVIYRGGFHGF